MAIEKLKVQIGFGCGYRYLGDEDVGERHFLQFEVWGESTAGMIHAASRAAMDTGNQGRYSTRGIETREGKTFSLALVEVTDASSS